MAFATKLSLSLSPPPLVRTCMAATASPPPPPPPPPPLLADTNNNNNMDVSLMEIVAEKKNNNEEKESSSSSTTSTDSRRTSCFQLLGNWTEKNNDINLVDQIENSFLGGGGAEGKNDNGLLVLTDSMKPFKKRKVFFDTVDQKKRETEEDFYKLLPLKKRIVFLLNVFKMEKQLTQSDVNSSSRLLSGNYEKIEKLLLNMNLTDDEECFPDPKHGKEINIYDSDTKKETTLMLRRWSTNSFVLNNGWREKFVKSRNLQKGDVIQFQWDRTSKRLDFSVVNNKVAALP